MPFFYTLLSRLKIFLLTIILLPQAICLGQVILIDPGHGGEDCGAKGHYIKVIRNKKIKKTICEKDLALQMALKLRDRLKKHYSTYLTRSIDRTISLKERAQLAEKVKADIFISIHLNASHSKHSHGFETYFLNNHNDKVIKKIEKIENSELTGKDAIIKQILIDLVIERTAPQSRALAKMIHKNIKRKIIKKHKIFDRGIKPAIFYVLALSKRPAVLLEAGFLSNPKETKKLLSKKFQMNYTLGVYQGIKEYYKKQEMPALF